MIRLWPQRRWLRLLLVALTVVFVPYLVSRLASPSRCVTVHGEKPMAGSRTFEGKLRVACFNIAHGRGLAISNWAGGDHATRHDRLSSISDLLADLDADIVVLNEVDFDSSWSGHVNQAELLANLAGYPFRVEQRNLDFRVLGWTWRFGNAVLSKHPIEVAQLIDLPGYSPWETTLVGKKRAVSCEVLVGGRSIRVIAAHLSHRSEALRVESARVLTDLIGDGRRPTVVAGDLNSTPPGFPLSMTDAGGNNAIDVFDQSKLLTRSPTTMPSADQLTFPADKPDRLIDWIMISRAWRFMRYRVVPTSLSDHRAVVAEMEFSLGDGQDRPDPPE